jgi:hypothetical protein
MRPIRILHAGVLIGLLSAACGGGSDGGTSSTSPPSTPSTPAANPCDSIRTATADAAAATGDGTIAVKPRGPVLDRDPRYAIFDALWTHEARRRGRLPQAFDTQGATADIGEIAVIQDNGDIILPANTFDLGNVGLSFVPNAAGGFDVRRGDATFQSELGTRLSLTDDDASNTTAAFSISFFGTPHASAWVNSDGNITFGESDTASTERDVSRFLTGPPRIAVAFADLDPSAGGAVFVNARSDTFTVTWCAVPGFEDPVKTTAQAIIARDGRIDIKVAGTTTRKDAIVGMSPGRTNVYRPVDLTASSSGDVGGGAGAVGERFAASDDVDLVTLARKFYESHPDAYDQLVVWSDRRLGTDAFAYEITVANEVEGVGIDIYDSSRTFGSAGRLRSMVMMDSVAKYPADPQEKFLGENSTVSVIGQEAGHRWLAFLEFRDAGGRRSSAILGRDAAHWSFFADSDGSVMEGNDIEDLGGGTFRTVGAVTRFSQLDQYAMGLLDASEVPRFFYVENPVNVQPPREADSAPRIGVTFSGTRRDVLIQDIVAAMGQRRPAAAASPRVHAQAFIHLVSAGRDADTANVSKLDRFRREWETFFLKATDGRMRAETRLR